MEYNIQFNVDSDKGTTTDTTVFKGIEGKTYFDENIVAPVVTAKSGFEFEGWDPVFIETDKIESDQIFHAVFKEVPVCVPAKVNQMNILKTDNRYDVEIKLTSPVELYATANHWKGTWQSVDAGITWTNYALGNIPSGQGQDPHVTFKDSCGNLIEVNYSDLKPYINE